ncbi:hypothetical protein OAS86_00605 [Gammaproteobacteria bacterium]|nr:hypothetical protein [Gammaproteobacteria bacterium]
MHSRTLSLLRKFARHGGTYGIYIPDIQVHYGVLKGVIPTWAIWLSRWQLNRELEFHRRHARQLFVQSEEFGDAIGGATTVLPPAIEARSSSARGFPESRQVTSLRLVYIGGLVGYYPLHGLINWLDRNQLTKLPLHVFTRSTDLERMSAEDREQLQRVAIIQIDRDQTDFDRFVQAGDIGVAAYDSHKYLTLVSPVKFWDYLSLSLPVLVSDAIPQATRLTQAHNLGWTLEALMTKDIDIALMTEEYLKKRANIESFKMHNLWRNRFDTIANSLERPSDGV